MIKKTLERALAYRRNFVLYFFVGGLSALTEWATFYLLHQNLIIDYRLAAVGGFIVATAVNYVLSVKIVFQGGSRPVVEQVFLIYLVSLLALGVNMATMVALVELVQSPVMFAKVAGTGAAFLWNFAGRQFYIFPS